MNKKVKPVFWVLLGLAAFTGICLLAYALFSGEKEIPENVTLMNAYENVKNDEYVKQISVEELEDLQNGILLISSPACSHCQKAVPVLTEAAYEKKQIICYASIDEMDDVTYYRLCDYLAEICKDNDLDGLYTPMVVAIRDGEPIAMYLGTAEEKELKQIYFELFSLVRNV